MTGGTSGIGLALIRKLLDENVEILMLRRKETSRDMELPEHELLHVEYCALEELKEYQPQGSYDVFFIWDGKNISGRTEKYDAPD